jgi:hypothetical protein
MYWDDHNPPHFHAEFGDFEAIFSPSRRRAMNPKSAHKHLKRILVTFLSLKIPNPFLLTGLLWPKSFFVSSYHRNFVSRESMIARKEVL